MRLVEQLNHLGRNKGWLKLAREFSEYKLKKPSVINAYHDLLLFHYAFPTNKQVFDWARTELNRVEEETRKISDQKNTAKYTGLHGTGISHTTIICSYSRNIVVWLTNRFPGAVELDSCDSGYVEIINVLQILLPAIEFQVTTQSKFNLNDRIKQVTGLKTKSEQLLWLVDLFAASKLPESLKDELYAHLKIFVAWKLDNKPFNRTCLLLPVAEHWVQGKFLKSIQCKRIIKQKINSPVLLSAGERAFLMDVMKASLALYCRETDPVTFADAGEVELFDMGRGLYLALVGMQKEKRLSLENYIGYMAFKNGVPIAYGGGWIWGQRCRIGISIYPPFRKRESAWLFGQVLRLYYQYFNVRHFLVRANQFGKDNPEGLKTGAFWFYYKLGFRPINEELKKPARDEWKQIRANKNYRSSLKTLKLFTSSPVEWSPDKESFPPLDAEEISRKISDFINNRYNCSRIEAFRSIRKKIKNNLYPVVWPTHPTSSNQIFENWSLLINLIRDFRDWDLTDKKRLVELIYLKQAGQERDHIVGMQKFPVFWKSLKGIALG